MARTLTIVWGVLIVGVLALWIADPSLFSEAVVAAGLARMPYRRMILGIVIGELPLVTAYILLGHRLLGALAA